MHWSSTAAEAQIASIARPRLHATGGAGLDLSSAARYNLPKQANGRVRMKRSAKYWLAGLMLVVVAAAMTLLK